MYDALRETLAEIPGIRPAGAHAWEARLEGLSLRLWAEDDFLRARVPAQPADPVDLARANGRLRGAAKHVVAPEREATPFLACEVHLEWGAQARRALRETLAGLGGSERAQGVPLDQARLTELGAELRDAGWKAEVKGGNLSIELGGLYRAELGGDAEAGSVLSVVLGTEDEQTCPEARRAACVCLLRAGALLRCVRGCLRNRRYELEVAFAALPPAAWLADALAMLQAGVELCAREIELLLADRTLAALYLEASGIPITT